MFWIFLMAVVTFGLLGWFGYKVFSGGIDGPSDASTPTGSAHSSGTGGSAGEIKHRSANDAPDATTGSGTGSSASADASSSSQNGSGEASAATLAAVAVGAGSTAIASGVGQQGPAATQTPIAYDNVASGADINASGVGSTGHAASVSTALASDAPDTVREMIKILNLRESDASRLGIETDQFSSLWQGNTDAIDASTVSDVRARLHHMLS